jgi:hypothetical protein
MNPLFMTALASAIPGIAQGVGNYIGGMSQTAGNTAGNVQSQALLNTPAANPAQMGEQYATQMFDNFGPNSRRGQQIQQMTDRQAAQRFNYDNKALNEAMSRGFGVDSYRTSQKMAAGAIDQYLQNSANMQQQVGNLLSTRF